MNIHFSKHLPFTQELLWIVRCLPTITRKWIPMDIMSKRGATWGFHFCAFGAGGASLIGHSHHPTEVLLQKEFHHSPLNPHAPKWGKKQHSNDTIRDPYTFYHIKQPERQNQSTSPILPQKTTTQFLQNMWCNMLLEQVLPKRKKVLNVRNSLVQFQFCFAFRKNCWSRMSRSSTMMMIISRLDNLVMI